MFEREIYVLTPNVLNEIFKIIIFYQRYDCSKKMYYARQSDRQAG